MGDLKPGEQITLSEFGGRTRKRRPRAAANLDGVALAALTLEAGPLRDLVGWPPVGALVESLSEAAQGDGGLSRKDVDRLRAWSARWRLVRPRLRGFYRSALLSLSMLEEQRGDSRYEQQAVSKALWRIFEGFDFPGWAHGAIRGLWERTEGSLPAYDIVPRGRCGTTRPQ